MYKKIIVFLWLSLVSCLVGCETEWRPSVYDIFQVPATTRIYLNSNHWYTDPLAMDSFNYQKGKILPFGTEVVDVTYDDDSVSFVAKDTGTKFRIQLKKDYSMITIEQYIKSIFMVKNPAEIELSIKPTVYEKITRGVVERGMTKKEVVIAYGPPIKHRTPSMESDTWIYYDSELKTKRIVFKHGVVSLILNY